jgi:hypothetical protein
LPARGRAGRERLLPPGRRGVVAAVQRLHVDEPPGEHETGEEQQARGQLPTAEQRPVKKMIFVCWEGHCDSRR